MSAQMEFSFWAGARDAVNRADVGKTRSDTVTQPLCLGDTVDGGDSVN